jgi:hypothetical protein
MRPFIFPSIYLMYNAVELSFLVIQNIGMALPGEFLPVSVRHVERILVPSILERHEVVIKLGGMFVTYKVSPSTGSLAERSLQREYREDT